MIIRINKPHLWELRFVGIGLVIALAHRKGAFYGKSQGWKLSCCLRKNTIYER